MSRRLPPIWPTSIVVFFLMLALFNGWLYWTATHGDGLAIPLSSEPYEDGLRYQETIDRLEQAAGQHRLPEER